MQPIRHHSNNIVFKSTGTEPNNVEVLPLPATVAVEDDVHTVETFWKPTAVELECLFDGGHVILKVWGNTMPAVALTARRK
jgi:hypothetical protein